MKNIFLVLALFLILLLTSSQTLAKEKDISFLAALTTSIKNIFAQDDVQTTPASPEMQNAIPVEDIQEEQEEFVDPRETKQVLKEIKDMRRELNRFSKQLKKLSNNADDVNLIDTLLGQIAGFENTIKSGVNLRDTIQEFRDEQIWEQINRFRAKIEIPKEIKQWNREIKILEKTIKLKSYRNFNLNLENAKIKIEEIKSSLAEVQGYYNSGNLEDAMEEFNFLRQELHPSEILNVIQRIRDLAYRLKVVKDEEIKNQVSEIIGEVVNNFNEGEYRMARELMDESWNDISLIIYKAYSVGKKNGYTKKGFLEMADRLEENIKDKAEEKRARLQESIEMKPKPTEPVVEQVEPKPVEPKPTETQPSPAPAEGNTSSPQQATPQ